MTETNGSSAAPTSRRGTVNSSAPQANGKASYTEKHKVPEHYIGGNKLENAPDSKIKDFVAKHDGHTVITNVSRPLSSPLPSPLPSGARLQPPANLARS